MAYITGSVFDSLGILPFSLAAGTQLTMSIQNNSNAPSYYGLETIPNNNGFYTSATPKNTSGSYISGSGISYITYDDYKMVAVVNPGGGTLVYTPSVAVSASTVWTKGTGASLLPATVASLLPGSYNQRVVNSGGYVESPDSITAAIAATPMLEDASFLYIPSGYSSGTAFSELSTNDYGDLTWSRASDGTRTNSERLVQRVPWNLVGYSEAFSNAYWTKSNASISADTTTAPNGTLTADKLVENTANSSHQILSTSTTVTVGTNYVSSIYAKAGERNWVLFIYYDGSTVKGRYFDLTNGVGGAYWAGATITNSITSVGDGWYRITLSYPATSTGNILGVYLADSDNNNSYTGNGTSGIYIWGAQLVEGTSPQSYLPTTTRLNVPRLDYTYGTSPASLMEPQRTNLALYSQQFDDASWTKTNVSVTANSTTSPDGSTNADTFTANGVSAFHIIEQSFNIVSGSNYTFSVYAKKNTNNFLQIIGGSSNFGLNAWANFDLNNGVVGSVGSSTTASIVNVGNGWYRCVMVAQGTATSAGTSAFGIISSSTAGRGEINTLTTSVFLYGAQLEQGTYPSTYIPTTSTTVTRIIDFFSRNNIYTNGLITSNGGTWFIELRNNVAYIGDAGGDAIFLGDTNNTSGNNFRLYNPPSLSRIQIFKTVSTVATPIYTTTTDIVKIAIKWNGTTADVFVNGTKFVSATAFPATQLQFFGTLIQVPRFIQAMALFNQPLAGVDMGVLTGASYYPSFLNMAQANNYTIA